MNLSTRVCAALALAVLAASQAWADAPPVIGLRYDPALQKIGFPSPVLTIKIDDQEARFLIDSGAGVHTFASWYVKAAGLKPVREAGVHAVDAGGSPVDLLVVRDARLTLANSGSLDIGEAAVADFPPLFEQLKIAGLLSPQLLATQTQAAVLDLKKPGLRFEPMQSALERLNATVQSSGSATGVCTNKSSPLANRIYVIRTLVDGVATSLTIDTGATSTSIRDGIPAARALRAKPGTGREQMGLTGQRVRVFQSAPVDIDFGGGPRHLSIAVGPNASGCGSQGLLGMDALAGCRWIFGSAAFAMSCVRTR